MSQIFNIVDDKVVINKLAVKYTEGSVTHAGSFDIVGSSTIGGNLVVNGAITVDTLTVKNLVTDSGGVATVGDWAYNTESELNGKGFSWTSGTAGAQLLYRTGGRLWTNAHFDLDAASSYNIDSTPVLSAGKLGDSVTKSNLRTVGTLNSLNVAGSATIGQFAFFNETYNRLGIGVEEPNAAISIVENNVEIAIGSPKTGLGEIGTYSNHDLAITTDNVVRILVKNSGEVHVGDEVGKTGVLRVYGKLYADSIETDSRINRTHPLQFLATADTSIYGLGLTWTGTDATRQLIMMAGPDRLWSSESIDLGNEKAYHINGTAVLTSTSLGDDVVNSNLITVGNLESLTVAGNVTLNGDTEVNGLLNARTLVLNDGETSLSFNSTGFNSTGALTISSLQSKILYADAGQISIGDNRGQRKPVKVFGPLSVGITNPDPSLNFSVHGDVNIGGKRFTNGIAAPSTGTFEIGDICWNTNPRLGNHIGWVCISAGDPGQWLPFGPISA